MNILLIGPPGAGKTVIANKIAEHYSIPFIKTGSLLRDLTKENPNYEIINASMQKGELAPNNLIAQIVSDEVSKHPNGYVLDGWMRQISDKDVFNPSLTRVIFLDCPKEVCKDRILNRVVCRIHTSIYSYSGQVCHLCGGTLEKRTDDTPETFENRWSVYTNLTQPVINYYQDLNLLLKIDASKSIPEIMDEIKKGLNDNN
jgi:adenylate kinase